MNEQTIGPDRLVGVEIGGKYKIVRLLGEGGMGCVYQGEQKLGTTIRKVAIKTLHEHLSHDPQILARFEREVGTVAGLQHPNTIQVFDFGTMDDGTLYIVMEFVEGQSVAAVLESGGPLEPPRVLSIMKQVCGSLEEAHGLGIVHRDLKPDNIVLCERAGQHDWVEVLDFGIAKRSSEADEREQKLTQQGMVLGTPPYMSPEQFTGKPVDRRSDIYSLAVMAYEMLTGGLPFSGNTAWEWATAHMTAQPRPIDSFPVSHRIPPAMKAAIMRGLAKDPDQRFPTVTDFFQGFSAAAPDGGYPRVPTQPGAPLHPMTEGMAPIGAVPYPTGPQPMGTPAQGSHAYTPQPFPQMMAPAPAPMPPKKKGAGGIIFTIFALLVLAAGAAVAAGVYFSGKRAPSAPADTASAASAVASATPSAAPRSSDSLAPLAFESASAGPSTPALPKHATSAVTHTAPAQTATPTYTTAPPPTYTPTQPVYTAPPTYTPTQPTTTAPPANEPEVCKLARQAHAHGARGGPLRDLKNRCMQQNGGIAPF